MKNKKFKLLCCMALLGVAISFSACGGNFRGKLNDLIGFSGSSVYSSEEGNGSDENGDLSAWESCVDSVSSDEQISSSDIEYSDTEGISGSSPLDSDSDSSLVDNSSEATSSDSSDSKEDISENSSENSSEADSSEASSENSSSDNSSSEKDSSSTSDSNFDSSSDAPEDESTKTVEKEETDSIGHKIVYYSDGTWEDQGRVVSLDFFPEDYTNKYGYLSLAAATNGEVYTGFYADLYSAAMRLAKSDTDVTLTEDGYTISVLFYGTYGMSENEALGVWKLFRQDNPQFYWLTNSVITAFPMLMYLNIDAEYATASARAATQAAIEAMALDCDQYLSGKTSEMERALTIYDYVIGRVNYAYQADGSTPSSEVWAHNIDGAATHGKGVCETYAETYDYLCDLFGVNAVTVVGQASNNISTGGHAWNIVEIDGVWYAVDATWGDGLYVTDGTTVSFTERFNRAYFGMTDAEISITHTADQPIDGMGINHQFALPTLSNKSLTPVLLTDDQGVVTMEKSIDDAFEKMVNAGGMYAINLYPDTKYSQANGTPVHLSTVTFSSALPTVKTLRIIGKTYIFDNGTYQIATLKGGDVILHGNVIVSDLILKVDALSLGVYTFTGTGNFTNIDSKTTVTGETGSVLVVETDMDISAIDLPCVEVRTSTAYLTMKGETRIGTLRLIAGHAQTYSAQNLTIDTLVFGKESVSLYINNAATTTQIVIGDIYGTESQVGYVVLNIGSATVAACPQVYLTGERDTTLVIGVVGLATTYTVAADGKVTLQETA